MLNVLKIKKNDFKAFDKINNVINDFYDLNNQSKNKNKNNIMNNPEVKLK